MNTKAKKLIQKKAMAKNKLKLALATGNAKAVALYKAEIQLIKLKQIELRRQQQSHLQKTKLIANKSSAIFKRHLNSEQKYVPLKSVRIKNFSLAVQASPAFEIAPVYRIPVNFTEKQRSKATWTLETHPLLPLNLGDKFKRHFKPKPYKMSCSASLNQRRSRWEAQLSAVNPS